MESLIFVDSNILCYYFDRSAPEHDVVSEKLEEVLDDGVAVNTVEDSD
jgi:predicted nucleic acid-binding protein